jgi:hypothetical protein
MQFSTMLKASVALALLCGGAQAQETPAKEAPPSETKGMPPRATPADYQAQGQAGTVTIGAEFKGHSVPTPLAVFSSEDYVVVEIGLFGPPDARLKLSIEDFSLRINGKKAVPALQYGLVFRSLKDPEWVPPEPAEGKGSKTSFGGGGKADAGAPPVTPKMPMPLQHAMEQKVQKASMAEGDRALPQAGLIYFQYRGKTQNIQSLELLYAGPAGKATLALQP